VERGRERTRDPFRRRVTPVAEARAPVRGASISIVRAESAVLVANDRVFAPPRFVCGVGLPARESDSSVAGARIFVRDASDPVLGASEFVCRARAGRRR
jgi:hypothetical protein